ncbi:unnamed protein product [Nesidiocoris tenuis]|uniref:PDZ domain-containing protein n=1 Tax=Nesidiocoris tenuis TaxID=355587 RepID=A0A6H5GXK8_9HEMI|nr:unnamed protein product [Nesidiocoris tenuis]
MFNYTTWYWYLERLPKGRIRWLSKPHFPLHNILTRIKNLSKLKFKNFSKAGMEIILLTEVMVLGCSFWAFRSKSNGNGYSGARRSNYKPNQRYRWSSAPVLTVVPLRSHDFTGLGFNICGNMRDGIFVKDVLHRGPASESGRISAGIKNLKEKLHNSLLLDDKDESKGNSRHSTLEKKPPPRKTPSPKIDDGFTTANLHVPEEVERAGEVVREKRKSILEEQIVHDPAPDTSDNEDPIATKRNKRKAPRPPPSEQDLEDLPEALQNIRSSLQVIRSKHQLLAHSRNHQFGEHWKMSFKMVEASRKLIWAFRDVQRPKTPRIKRTRWSHLPRSNSNRPQSTKMASATWRYTKLQ